MNGFNVSIPRCYFSGHLKIDHYNEQLGGILNKVLKPVKKNIDTLVGMPKEKHSILKLLKVVQGAVSLV